MTNALIAREEGFRCPYCDADKKLVKVIDVRATLKERWLKCNRRTRLCLSCNKRFSTYELYPDDLELLLRTHNLSKSEEHRDQIETDAARCIVTMLKNVDDIASEIPHSIARTIVNAISRGAVDHVSIEY